MLRKLIILAAVSLAFSEASWAAPSNGTRFPAQRRLEMGYEYNVMFKRALDRSYGNISTRDHLYTLSFGAFDWLALDGEIGVGDMMFKDADHLPKLEFNAGFAGGYGLRIRALNLKKIGLRAIVGAQHICVHPPARTVNGNRYDAILDDWQISALAAKDFKFLTIYAGMKGSDCEVIYKVNKHDRKRRFSKNHAGLITGLEFYLFDNKAKVGVEGRFFDETALSTTVSYLF